MAVTVNPNVRETMAQDVREIALAFVTSAEVPIAFRALDQARRAALVAVEEDGGIQGPVPLPIGAGIYVHDYDFQFDDMMAALVGHLEAAGLSGELAVFTTDAPSLPVNAELLECRLSLKGEPTGEFGRWRIAPEALPSVVDAAVAWCAGGAESSTLCLSSNLFSYELEPAEALEWLPLALEGGPLTKLWWQHDEDFRQVHFSSDSAHVAFRTSIASSLGSWRRALSETRRLLTWSAPWAVYGLVKRGIRMTTPGSPTFIEDWVPMPHLRRFPRRPPLRHYEERFVPDVFGLQLLSRGHLDRAPTGGAWRVTEVAEGSQLVEHADPEAWFGQASPAAEVLEAGRRDFDDLLLTDDIAWAWKSRI